MTPTNCKWCASEIKQTAIRLQYQIAYTRGFCCPGCMEAFFNSANQISEGGLNG